MSDRVRYLVTGGAGFIGSHFVRSLLSRDPQCQVTTLDCLGQGGSRATVEEFASFPNHNFVEGDIRHPELVDRLVKSSDVVVNFAAETHVDRSISGPTPFFDTNVTGTGILLSASAKHSIEVFVQVSTDEVYGSITEGSASVESPLRPSSPYAASKAAGDLAAHAFHTTFDVPVITTRCTNNFGPFQHPEKLIPLFVTNLLDGQQVPLYGDGRNERDWLFVLDHCEALHVLIEKGQPGQVYNIGADSPLTNLSVANRILDHMGLDQSWIDFVPDRLGHDFRYAVDSSALRSLGWSPRHPFDVHLSETIDWYRAHTEWWRPLKASE